MKSIDKYLGAGLARFWPAPASPRQSWRGPVLMIRPGGIGDAVHLIPLIKELKRRHPECPIDILAERRNAGVFNLCPGVRAVYRYDQPGELLRVLRSSYGVVIDTEQWHRLSAVTARMLRAPMKIGLATNERARMFTHPVAYSHNDYEVDTFLRMLAPLGIEEDLHLEGPWLQLSEAACRAAAKLLAADDTRPLIVLFPGASVIERRWGAEKFHAVAKWCQQQGLRIVVVGGKEDVRDAECIVGTLDVLNLAGRTTLEETASVLARAAVIVCGDTGLLHIAVGLDRPTVSLFGPGIASKWAPKGPQHVVLNKKSICSPCTRFGYTPSCPRGVRCMHDISVSEVTLGITKLLPLLASNGNP